MIDVAVNGAAAMQRPGHHHPYNIYTLYTIPSGLSASYYNQSVSPVHAAYYRHNTSVYAYIVNAYVTHKQCQ